MYIKASIESNTGKVRITSLVETGQEGVRAIRNVEIRTPLPIETKTSDTGLVSIIMRTS